ncbi:MAG: hypothetical protein GY810_21865 [Aureispira sp.]|nr:hypothetical protein [Aureispira sp.]
MSISIHKKHQLKGHRAAVYALSPYTSPDSFLSASGDGWVALWEHQKLPDGQLLAQIEGNIFSLCYLPKQHWLVIGNMYGGVHWIDLATNKNLKNSLVHKKGVYAIEAIGEELYSLGGQGCLSKWSIEQQKPLETLQLSNKSLRSLCYNSAQDELIVGASDCNIYVLDRQSLTIKQTLQQAHDNSVFALALTSDKQYLLSGGRDAYLRIWNSNNNYKKVEDIPAHWFTLNYIAPHPNLPIIATASRDKTIRLWNSETFKPIGTIDTMIHGGHPNSINSLLWINNGSQLISCSDDRTLIVWDVEFV